MSAQLGLNHCQKVNKLIFLLFLFLNDFLYFFLYTFLDFLLLIQSTVVWSVVPYAND
jgi:hypothetical protein